jgi:hypothetical protein
MAMPPEQQTPDAWGPVRSKTVRWHDPVPTAALRMSGAEYLAAMQDGRLPGPPINALLGMELVSFGEGEAVVRCAIKTATLRRPRRAAS